MICTGYFIPPIVVLTLHQNKIINMKKAIIKSDGMEGVSGRLRPSKMDILSHTCRSQRDLLCAKGYTPLETPYSQAINCL